MKKVIKTIEILDGESVLDVLQQELLKAAQEELTAHRYKLSDARSNYYVDLKFDDCEFVDGRLLDDGSFIISTTDTLQFDGNTAQEYKRAQAQFTQAKLERQLAELA